MGLTESATTRVEAPPELLFRVIVDPARLPAWNEAITEVVEAPRLLQVGSQWKVRLHALGQSWVSKSQVAALDLVDGRFAYRSQTDDGNPSYADWEWRVTPDGGGGSIVAVTVELHPATFWRRHLLVRVRRPALRREMNKSLNVLAAVVTR